MEKGGNQNAISFMSNLYIERNIHNSLQTYDISEKEYIQSLVQRGMCAFQDRLQHDPFDLIYNDFCDAKQFFNSKKINKKIEIILDEPYFRTLLMWCKQYKFSKKEAISLFLCYTLVRD